MRRRYPVIDVFSGAGFASLGFRRAGFRVVAALEIDSARCDVYERNLRLKPMCRDVMGTVPREVLAAAGLRRGSQFCVVGCPPCQPFSKLSDTTGNSARGDPRSRFVVKFAELVVGMRPAAVVFENVPAIASGPGKEFLDGYIDTLDSSGYRTAYGVVNASAVGVPQGRRRVVAVSVRRSLLTRDRVAMLETFHKIDGSRPATVRSAVAGLRRLRGGQRDVTDPLHFAPAATGRVGAVIAAIPRDGGSRASLPPGLWLRCHKKLGAAGGAGSSYGRMWWDRPAPTITGRCTTPSCGRFLHPHDDRAITLREAARLQTIPDTFDFGPHPPSRVCSMIGDGVPVKMATWIAKRLRAILQ